jgi:hypothetical protein
MGRFLPPFAFAPIRCWPADLAASATDPEQSNPATAVGGKATPELGQITGLFQRALSAGALNPDADFFDCGGQSLPRCRCVQTCGTSWGSRLTLASSSPYERLNASTIGFP